MKKYVVVLIFFSFTTNQSIPTLGLNRNMVTCLAANYLTLTGKSYHSPINLLSSSLGSSMVLGKNKIEFKKNPILHIGKNIVKNYILGKACHLGAQWLLKSIEPEIHKTYAPITSKILSGLAIYNYLGFVGFVPKIEWNPSIEYTGPSYLSVRIKGLKPTITAPKETQKKNRNLLKTFGF